MTWYLTFRHGWASWELNWWWVEILRQRQNLDDVCSILTRQLLIREQSGREGEVRRRSSDLRQQRVFKFDWGRVRLRKRKKQRHCSGDFDWVREPVLIFRLKTKTMRAEQGTRHGFGITWNAGRNKTREKNVAASNGKSTKPPEALAITKKTGSKASCWNKKKIQRLRTTQLSPSATSLPWIFRTQYPSIRKIKTPWNNSLILLPTSLQCRCRRTINHRLKAEKHISSDKSRFKSFVSLSHFQTSLHLSRIKKEGSSTYVEQYTVRTTWSKSASASAAHPNVPSRTCTSPSRWKPDKRTATKPMGPS